MKRGAIRFERTFKYTSRADRRILYRVSTGSEADGSCTAMAAWPSRASWQIKCVNNRLLWQYRHWIKGRFKQKNLKRAVKRFEGSYVYACIYRV